MTYRVEGGYAVAFRRSRPVASGPLPASTWVEAPSDSDRAQFPRGIESTQALAEDLRLRLAFAGVYRHPEAGAVALYGCQPKPAEEPSRRD